MRSIFMKLAGCLAILALFSVQSSAFAQTQKVDHDKNSWNSFQLTSFTKETTSSTPTLGGQQFWGDVAYFQGWKIQQNVFSEHYRLLDPNLRRHVYGSLKDCEDHLEATKAKTNMKPMSGKCIVLVHGMGCSSAVFRHHKRLFSEVGYTVIPFEYPSTRVKIEKSAEYLDQLIKSLDGITEINVLAHSMGGLVMRAWSAKHKDPRMHRLVMMGTPNKGAKLATIFKNVSLFRLALGPAGQQMATLAENGAKFADKFPAPKMEFAIIAGSSNTEKGFNALIPGDDDGTVGVESTKLTGAKDFCQVNCLHTHLINNLQVIRLCHNFLQTGQLDRNTPAQPIR